MSPTWNMPARLMAFTVLSFLWVSIAFAQTDPLSLPIGAAPGSADRPYLLLDSVASSLVTKGRRISVADYLVSATLLRNLLSKGDKVKKVALHLALLETIVNGDRFSSHNKRLKFFDERYALHQTRSPEVLAMLLSKAGYMGFRIAIDRVDLGTKELNETLRFYPEYVTRGLDLVPAAPGTYNNLLLKKSASLTAAGKGQYRVQHLFDPSESLFRLFLSNLNALSPSNQFSIAANTQANFSPGLYPKFSIASIYDAAHRYLKELDARIKDPTTSDPDKQVLRQKIQDLSEKLVVAANAGVELMSAQVPASASGAAGAGLQDQSSADEQAWKDFGQAYKENSKLFYQTLKDTAQLLGITDPYINKSIDQMQTLTNLVVAAGTQNYLALAASGIQIAGQIFGSGSNGSDGGTAAMVQQLVAIRKDIANLRMDMMKRFDQVDRKLDQIDKNLTRQFDFLSSHFRMIEDELKDIISLEVSEAEQEYQYRLNALSSLIDTYNQRFWLGLLKGIDPFQSDAPVIEAADSLMATYLTTDAGATGLSHPRFVGSYECFERLWRDLTTAESSTDAFDAAVTGLFRDIRASNFDHRGSCVHRIFDNLVAGGVRMRVAPFANAKDTEVDWLPGYFDDNGMFVLDGVNFLYSPETVNAVKAGIDGRLLKIEDAHLLELLMEKKLVHLTNVTKNMTLIGNTSGFQAQVVLYLRAATKYLRNEDILLRALLSRALISHGVYIQEKFLTQFGSIDGAYSMYRVPPEVILYQYSAGHEGEPAAVHQKQYFDNRKTDARTYFETQSRALMKNIDDVIAIYFGGYQSLLGAGCGHMADCTTWTYSTRHVDYFLNIETVTVTMPTLDMTASHPHKDAIKVLLDLLSLEIKAATDVFNTMGDDISDYPKPPFGRNGTPFYTPGDPMPLAQITKFEDRFTKVLETFRTAMKSASFHLSESFGTYMSARTGTDARQLADELVTLVLIGSAIERNLNEVVAAYERLGRKNELQTANVSKLDLFDKKKPFALHFVRAACGTKVGEKCLGQGANPIDVYPFSSYLIPFLIGKTPEDLDRKQLRLYFQQNDASFFNYLLSVGWLAGPRLTEGHIRSEQPAFDVHWSQGQATDPIFPLFDPEFLYISDGAHAAFHPGVIGAGKKLSPQGAAVVGTWNSAIPGCSNQQLAFNSLPASEQSLYKKDPAIVPNFGDPSDYCALTHSGSRYVAMALVDQMYVYSLNQGAVDYLAGIRADYKANVIARLFPKAAANVANQYATESSYRQLTRGQVH